MCGSKTNANTPVSELCLSSAALSASAAASLVQRWYQRFGSFQSDGDPATGWKELCVRGDPAGHYCSTVQEVKYCFQEVDNGAGKQICASSWK